jgi:hypothetical protein
MDTCRVRLHFKNELGKHGLLPFCHHAARSVNNENHLYDDRMHTAMRFVLYGLGKRTSSAGNSNAAPSVCTCMQETEQLVEERRMRIPLVVLLKFFAASASIRLTRQRFTAI